jgi:hypothetical protein
VRQTTRVAQVPTRFGEFRQHLHAARDDKNTEEYSIEHAHTIAHIMCHYNNPSCKMMSKKKFYQLVQRYSVQKGIKKFGKKGKNAAYKEMRQLHERVVFKPIKVESLTRLERQIAMESLIFLIEKRDGSIKARTCANGSTQRYYIPKEEAASPIAATESIIITGVIEAKQNKTEM